MSIEQWAIILPIAGALFAGVGALLASTLTSIRAARQSDIDFLRAEIIGLRAEIEQLEERNRQAQTQLENVRREYHKEVDRLRQEMDHLRDENGVLRSTLSTHGILIPNIKRRRGDYDTPETPTLPPPAC